MSPHIKDPVGEEKWRKLAEEFLRLHYPEKEQPIDVKYSAVLNFAEWLSEKLGRTVN